MCVCVCVCVTAIFLLWVRHLVKVPGRLTCLVPTCARDPCRWIEYSLSASVMRIQIAQLCGVLDLHLNVAIFGLSMTTMLFGLLQEMTTYSLQGQPDKKSLFPYWCVPPPPPFFLVLSFSLSIT